MSGAVATARPTQALRVRRESQRPGVARVVTKTPNIEDESTRPEPKLYVYTQEAVLARHRGKLPSMRVHLFPNHFRINDSQETLTYASPMREILTALREKKLPHNMLEELYANGTPFYDGCLIVEVHNYRNNTAKPKDNANSADDDSKTAFSIHNNNNFITPSPYGSHPSNKPEPKANANTAQAKEAGDKEDKENMPAPGTTGASQKQPASGPKISTVVLFPTPQSQLADMAILATTPATDAATLKRMQAAGRGTGMPPTPLTGVPPTPTFSAGPSPKRQKMVIDDSNAHEFEAETLLATCPKLYLEPTKSFAESVALIDAMTHPNNKNPPPERKSRKRTTAELAADEADAQNLQSFMLAGDEQQTTLNATTAGADENAVRAAANTMSFARFKTLATIKANHEEADRRKKEEDARQAQAKRQAQLESEAQKRRDLEANRQQAEVQEQRQQLLARQQALQQNQMQQNQMQQNQMQQNQMQQNQMQQNQMQQNQMQQNQMQQNQMQQNQMQQNEALRAAQQAQMSNAAASQISQTPQSATQNQFSPSVRQNTPMAAAAASPRVGGQASHPMGGTPMVATASNHAIASPARPPSSISHHAMARTASQQQGSMSRTNTPQLMQGTPVMNSAMPNRNMTPTPRMNQGSPSLQVQGATPIMMQTPQSQNMTPEQMQAMQAQQNQQRMQQMRLQQLQNQQQMNGMSPGAQNLQQMAMQKAQMHVQAQGIPNGQNAALYQQRLAQGYFQQFKQQAQAQQQQSQQHMTSMSPQGSQNPMPTQQPPNNMANMSVAQLRTHYQQRKQQLLATFGQQVPQQHVQQMHQLEQLIRSKEQAQLQAQQQMGQNQMNMNQGLQGQVPAGGNPMQMQQYQQALLQQRANAQRNEQIMRMRQQAMQQGGQMPQGMMNNMQGMNMNMNNMGQMNMGNMQGMNMQNMQGMQGMQNMNMGQMSQQQMQQMMMLRAQQQQRMQQQQQQQQGDMNWNGV